VRILILSQHFWPENFIINDVASQLNKNNKVVVYTGQPNYPSGIINKNFRSSNLKKYYYSRIPVYRVPIIARGKGSKIKIVINYLSFIFFGILFSKNLIKKEKNFDLILVYATSPILQAIVGIYIKFLTKSKLVIWIQDLWPFVLKDTGYISNKLVLNIVNYLVKFIYQKADVLLAQSMEFKKFINSNYNVKKILVHENPGRFVNIKFSPKSSKKKIFLFTGNIGHAQAIQSLVEVEKKIKNNDNFIIKIVGEGSKYKWLKKEIKTFKLEDKIITTGYIQDKYLTKFYKEATCLLVLLSDGFGLEKTIPNKFQNYLSVGKPILCYGTGAVAKKVIKNKLGYCVKTNNSSIFYNTLKKISKFSDVKMKIFYKRNVLYFKKYYKVEKNVKKLEIILKRVC